jgi:hypothetical protein
MFQVSSYWSFEDMDVGLITTQYPARSVEVIVACITLNYYRIREFFYVLMEMLY